MISSDNAHYKELKNQVIQLGLYYDTHQVFTDFVEIAAIVLSNAVDNASFEKREARYLQIIKRYTRSDVDTLTSMFALLVEALSYEMENGSLNDVLGVLYHDLTLHNKWKGQYFTPMNICNMMGEIAYGENRNKVETLLEPCVGSGALVLGFANAMIKKGANFQRQLLVTAIDIDLKCVHMSYIQFSLYGISATVIHGDTLIPDDIRSTWHTPWQMLRHNKVGER